MRCFHHALNIVVLCCVCLGTATRRSQAQQSQAQQSQAQQSQAQQSQAQQSSGSTAVRLSAESTSEVASPVKRSNSYPDLLGPYDRPTGWERQSRSETVAKHGIVATSHPLASQAGLEVLQDGGNAVDAAIAANAMLGVVEPMSCGIGGDLFAIVWESETQTLYGLNASGRSPAAISRQLFRDRGLKEIPLSGPLSWTVPGCVSGWEGLSRKFGSLPLKRLLQPSAEVAELGFPVSPVISGIWRGSVDGLKGQPSSASTFLLDGERSPEVGELFRNPDLAETYRRIGRDGGDAFYQGAIAEQIAAYSAQVGGLLSLDDLKQHSIEWVKPVSTNYRGYRVWELPPNGQGIAALEMLNILERFELSGYSPGHPEYLHLLIEAKKLAFADRAKFYADMNFFDVPLPSLVSEQYGKQQATRIDRDRAATDVPAGDPKLAAGDTVYLTVVDKDRNCCSLIQSNYYSFGSKMTVDGLGFALQNRGALFALDDEHANRLEPGKRPFHTIIPAMVTQGGRPVFSFGVMGGDMQPQGHVQVLVNMIDFGLNVQAAGDAARVRHTGSAQPTGKSAEGAGVVHVESGISDEAVEVLETKGHTVKRGGTSYGGYQGIWIDWRRGVLHGATEARKDGIALGY